MTCDEQQEKKDNSWAFTLTKKTKHVGGEVKRPVPFKKSGLWSRTPKAHTDLPTLILKPYIPKKPRMSTTKKKSDHI